MRRLLRRLTHWIRCRNCRFTTWDVERFYSNLRGGGRLRPDQVLFGLQGQYELACPRAIAMLEAAKDRFKAYELDVAVAELRQEGL